MLMNLFGRGKLGRKPPTSRQIARTLTIQYFQRFSNFAVCFLQWLKWTFKTVPAKLLLEMPL
jgi:hypothetical protein